MDLDLIKRESEEKVPIQLYLYQSVYTELKEISDREKVKFSHLLRHALNRFLEQYKKTYVPDWTQGQDLEVKPPEVLV